MSPVNVPTPSCVGSLIGRREVPFALQTGDIVGVFQNPPGAVHVTGASLAGDLGSDAYSMYELEQVKGTAEPETAVSSPAPAPGLVE